MKRTETVALYREAYLADKDEIDRQQFDSKTELQQYNAIMTWRKRQRALDARKETPQLTVSAIAYMIKKTRGMVDRIEDMSQNDLERLQNLLGGLMTELNDFKQIRKGRRLRELRDRQAALQREIAELENEGVKEC